MRILLVEDDPRLAASVHRGLEEAGFSVDAVHDGESGLVGATTTPSDALILDVMLPGLDGCEVTRRLRRASIRTPVLMLTARDAVDDRVTGLDAGADDYLVKPFALRELVARLRALTRRDLPDRGAMLTAGPIALDTRSHRLVVGDRPVELTAKEFAILEYFMLHPGLLLTRGQLFEHVWDYDFEGGRNLIEVYIGRLRHKLAAAGVRDPFVTLRGAGYRFEPARL
jgi:two-component system, OmpR family, response regulator